jgi:signal transduction histidine kinase
MRHGLRWVALGFLLLPSAFAQNSRQRDSLLAVFRQAPSDSVRVQVLLDIGKRYNTAAEARPWIDRALALSRRAHYPLGVANSLVNANYHLFNESRYDSVLANCETALRICRPLKVHKTLGVIYNYQANVYSGRGENRRALALYLLALRELEQADVPPYFPIVVEGNIIRLYNTLREFPKALRHGLRTLEQARRLGNEQTLGYVYQNLATTYAGLDQPDQSLRYWGLCRRAAAKVGDEHLLALAYSNLAEFADNRGDANQARQYYDESLNLARANEDHEIELFSVDGLALLHYRQGQWDRAYAYAQKALQLAQTHQFREYLTAVYLRLSDIEIARHRLREGERWRQKWETLRTSLTNETVLRQTQELEARYQTEKKNQQIRALQQERELQQLRLRHQRIALFSLAGLAVLLAVVGTLAYRNVQNRRRLAEQEIELTRQKIKQLEQEKQLSAVDGLLRGQEEERSRLARDLHDGLGGMLSGIKSALTAMKGNQILPEEAAQTFGRVIDNLDQSIQELRRVARNMMPEALVRFGLDDALRDYCAHVSEAGPPRVDYQRFGLTERLPQSVEIIVFRIVQELLNNIQKHAGAAEALVQLVRDGDRLHLTVEDNGRGFDTARLDTAPGVGWLNIRSRVDYLGGRLDLRSAPGQGTTVDIELTIGTV